MDKEKQEQFKNLENLSKDEATKLLKSMLRDVGVCSTWKWDDAFRNIKNDERYQFLKMPMQEKKSIFADYLHEARDEERQQLQLKKQRQRQLFFALIDECRDLGIVKLTSSSKYYIVSKKFALRDYKKFMAVDERDRDEIFQDYIDELFKQEREDAQEQTQ